MVTPSDFTFLVATDSHRQLERIGLWPLSPRLKMLAAWEWMQWSRRLARREGAADSSAASQVASSRSKVKANNHNSKPFHPVRTDHPVRVVSSPAPACAHPAPKQEQEHELDSHCDSVPTKERAVDEGESEDGPHRAGEEDAQAFGAP